MKYILTAAFALVLFASASAQQGPQVSVVRTVKTSYIASNNNDTSNMQAILDKLQQESENTVIYPLLHWTKQALVKAQSINNRHKFGRIRTNNSKKTSRA